MIERLVHDAEILSLKGDRSVSATATSAAARPRESPGDRGDVVPHGTVVYSLTPGEGVGLHHLGPEQSSQNVPVAPRPVDVDSPREGPRTSLDVVLQEREELLAKVRRLEAELERYRGHARRTSRMFQAVTDYAEWIKENARRDAELTLKKARARADKTLGKLAQERERTERELLRLQALTAETRTRLSAFTAIALQVLDAQGVEAVQANRESHSSLADDLKDALESPLASAAEQAAAKSEEPEH